MLPNNFMYYAGIGSRETPDSILDTMYTIGLRLGQRGYTLRSGGAEGADSAFEHGARSIHAPMEIYLPWNGFNGRWKSNRPNELFIADPVEHELEASRAHPYWNNLKPTVRKLHSRNVPQILGPKPYNKLSRFVVCYAKPAGVNQSGKEQVQGGTGQAVRIAHSRSIPVFNLYHEDTVEQLANFIERIEGQM